MQTIEIAGDHTILIRKGSNLPQDDDVAFLVNVSDSIKANVTLLLKQGAIEVLVGSYPISDLAVEHLTRNESPLANDLLAEIADIHLILSDCTTRVLSLIKYYTPYMDLSEQLFAIKSRQWRVPGKEWRPLPSSISVAFDGRTIPHFDQRTCKLIQDSLNENMVPLLGLRHLHRAKNEQLPHHKWIDATIAAELAVKEVLIRAHPELEPLILEVPSPSLGKLYGPILQAYLGERSPYLRVIKAGVEIRNRLVHKPSSERVDHQKAIDYINDIEGAIFHLLSLLYPGNGLIAARARLIITSGRAGGLKTVNRSKRW